MAGSAPPRQIPRFARNDSVQRRPHAAQPRAAGGGVRRATANMASTSKKITGPHIALLRDFDCEVDTVSLENGVTVRRLDLDTDTDDDTRLSFIFDPEKAFVLAYRQHTDADDPIKAFDDTITAMRLTGPGTVSIGQTLKPLNLLFRGPIFPVPYHLTKESVDTLSSLTVRLPQVKADSVRVAIFRFNIANERTQLAYGRDQPEDKLIDYWIALEALFLPHDQELSYRAALRISYFLGADADDRKLKFEAIKDSYDARSWVVHGERVSRRRHVPHVVAATYATEEILREALRLCVINAGEPRIEELDDAIVRGVTYRNSMGV